MAIEHSSQPKAYGFMGGTFNPVHCAHLRVAAEFVESFQLVNVGLVPCAIPVHREEPQISIEHRIAMLELAVSDSDTLHVDLREIKRSGPSYTVDTLRELRQQLGGDAAIYFAMGSDAFNNFESWHRYEEFFSLCNVVVMHRPEHKLTIVNDKLKGLLACFEGKHKSHGALYELDVALLDISSSSIRAAVSHKKTIEYLLPESVRQYIHQHKLYH